MKIALFSDLHLGSWNQRGFKTAESIILHIESQCKNVDLIVDCGDSELHYTSVDFTLPYIKVYGNHDYYNRSLSTNIEYNQEFDYVAATLWTNMGVDTEYSIIAPKVIYDYMNDFKYISGLSYTTWMHEHSNAIEKIEEKEPSLIFTHHAPCIKSVHPRYKGLSQYQQAANFGFVSNDLISDLNYKPKLWCHGHVHDAFDYEHNGVRIVCNPLGYPGEHYKNFYDYEVKIIEV